MIYYKNNLAEAYKTTLLVCMALICLCGLGTVYVIYDGYTTYQKKTYTTYVFSPNGAAIQVYVKSKK